MACRLDLETKTKWNISKAFKYNKRFLGFKKTESGTAEVPQGSILEPLFFERIIKKPIIKPQVVC